MVLGSMVTSLAADGFADVSTSHWACDAITEAVHYGIVSGYPDGTFRPNNKVSLAEFVKWQWWQNGKDPGPSKTGYWFNSYRSAAIDAGLLDSVIAGDSEMMREITRYDAALILADALSGRELSMAEQISAISLFPILNTVATSILLPL